jgi:hypothetical protein
MTQTYAWLLPFMFVMTALDVLIVGYRFVRRFPAPTVVVWVLVLLALVIWYRAVRRANDATATLTTRLLAFAMPVVTFVAPFLLRRLLGI